MLFTTIAALSSIAGLTTAFSQEHVLHEKRNFLPHGWRSHARAYKRDLVPVRIGLSQSNLNAAHDRLMEVSDPDHESYGKHWTDDDIAKFFAPSKETVDAVHSWLTGSGIAADRIKHSANRGWLDFQATIEEMEALLKTKYNVYKHETGVDHLACDSYAVPKDIAPHVDIITPTLHFDRRVGDPTSKARRRRSLIADSDAKLSKKGTSWFTGPTLGNKPLPSKNSPEVTSGDICGEYITPECIRKLYNLPVNKLNLSTFGIVEYYPETYLQSDLNAFQNNSLKELALDTNTGGIPVGTAPKYDPIDGGDFYTASQGFDIQGEPDLDLQYAMDLAWPQQITLLQSGDDGKEAGYFSFNNFLDALDKSYCTYDGGDDPNYDETFPDKGGWNKKEQCGVYTPPSVISTSYSYDEADLSPAYEARQCHEYMKLGLKGVSFLFSSGDYGVGGNGGYCINANGTGYTNGTYGMFNPAFPSTCPYITSVGATQIPEGTTVTTAETACETIIYSGGGFSNNFAVPNYQASAVANYLTEHKPTYTAAQFNNSGTSRAYPDVSANGANYIVYIDGEVELVYGTSASAPVFASIINQINNERLNANKTVLGFLNKAFYKNPSMFNDIVAGGNQGCGTKGFTAVAGWDPVTGLGTPNYESMLSYFMAKN